MIQNPSGLQVINALLRIDPVMQQAREMGQAQTDRDVKYVNDVFSYVEFKYYGDRRMDA